MSAVIQVKRGQAASWASANSVLSAGEFGYETDTGKLKLGDGVTAWNSLAYLPSAAARGAANGYASLDSNGQVPLVQIPPGSVVDGVTLQGNSFQFTSKGVNVGDPVSLLVASLDGGSPSSTADGFLDGGTL